MPDAFMGEEAVAALQVKDGETLTEDAVGNYCRAELARHKVPKYVRFVAEYQGLAGKSLMVHLRNRASGGQRQWSPESIILTL